MKICTSLMKMVVQKHLSPEPSTTGRENYGDKNMYYIKKALIKANPKSPVSHY